MAFDGTLAVLLAAKYCKKYPLFQWREEALPNIGKREEKYCFRVDMINLLQDRCGEMMLSLFPEQLSLLDLQKEDTLYTLKAILVTLKHPYLLPVVDISYSKEKKGVIVVQPFIANGSIKDRIHRANPTQSYSEKYKVTGASPLPFIEIARFGRQILEALVALRSKGISCEHLSTGNVIVDDQGNARIADIYSPLLAFDRHKKSRELTVSLEAKVDIDLLLFGHVLYEMATGMELTTPAPDDADLEVLAPEIAEILEMIFYPSRLSPSEATLDGDVHDEASTIDDDTMSTTSDSTVSSRKNGKIMARVSIETILSCVLFENVGILPIETLFSGFRFDSSMKAMVRASMRINASRNQAHIVHYNEKEALIRARQRAERRVYEEKEKHQQRVQQFTASRNPLVKHGSFNSKPTPVRRKSYRADSFRMPLHRQASSGSSKSSSNTNTTSA